MEKIVERTDICQLYLEFLSICLKSYSFAGELINKEVENFTKGELKDGWLFFLLVFSHGYSIDNAKDLSALKLYIENPESQEIILTAKGEALYAYLSKKIDLQASILKFNGISFFDLIGDINGISRVMKFWKLLMKSSNN